ncbi:MAG: type II secretion system GspH family protein [Desulfocapsa sp.]|nr:type II secretion system GspH family protein [Desulfocapsa sp.]
MTCRKEGFTLLELLIAIAIFGMVIGLAYSSYNATFHIIGSAEAQAKTYSKAKIAMERIISDLESFYPGDNPVFTGSSKSISGHRADTLTFTSIASVRLHADSVPVGHVIISYYVQEDPDSDSLLLYRSEQSALNGEGEDASSSALLLCDSLQEVAFDFYDNENQNVENWEEDEEGGDTLSLPTLITVSLRFNDVREEDEEGTLFQTSLTLPVAKKIE